ncbi:hypothetical protein C0971_16830 [Bacillus methanolicus]|uniref:O-antigen ligase family protein n=1 Tax=Bacillus methanolicus TaxID=1471 RepID=UPI00200F52A7|nr:O-antigen ligase family protein [Bacillus methanolicus]UQD53499.1 hypothetical protein C0971_16830 [Bacillus methanolicus]
MHSLTSLKNRYRIFLLNILILTLTSFLGVITALEPFKIFYLLLLFLCLAFYYFKDYYPNTFILIILLSLTSSNFIQMVFLQLGLIKQGTFLSSIVYYFPILITWIGSFLLLKENLTRELNVTRVDIIALIILLYLLLIGLLSPKPYGYDVFIMSFLRFSLFIPAYFLGRMLFRFNFRYLNSILFFLTVIIAVIGILDVLTNHKILISSGLGLFIKSNLFENENATIFYKAGFPRMMSVLVSPLLLGTISSAFTQYWFFKFITGNRKYIVPFLISLLILILTFTRASWISCILGITVLTFFFSLKDRYILKIIFVFWIFILGLILSISIVLENTNLSSFIIDTINGKESSVSEHIRGLNQGIIAIKENLFFGNGIGNSPYFQVVFGNGFINFESWYLDSIFSAGIIFILGFHLLAITGISRVQGYYRILLISWFLTFSFESVINHSWYQSLPVLIFWTTLGYLVSQTKENKNRS